ncbi:MAG TPA: HPP family protein [Desulfobulbaceae bacterium]|nr:HPP family protein [Desulfobulbaceae bacterium]
MTMKEYTQETTSFGDNGPQGTLLYRLVSFFSRLQLRYLLPRLQHPERVVRLFVFVEGSMALAVLSTAAYYTQFPLLFPPLGPSAFILFRMPMSAASAPRTVLLSHLSGLVSGFIALYLGFFVFSSQAVADPGVVSAGSIVILSLAMGLSSLAMIWFECNHPPATATALIVAMGYITAVTQVIGFIIAVVFLISLAFLFNRILGGLPYSYWRHNPETALHYGTLAGIADRRQGYWQQLTAKMFHLHV